VRLYALDSIDIDPLRDDLMAGWNITATAVPAMSDSQQRFPTVAPADMGKLLLLRMGLARAQCRRLCEEALDMLPPSARAIRPIDGGQRENG